MLTKSPLTVLKNNMKELSEILKKICEEIITFNKYIGIRFVSAEIDKVTIELPFKSELVGDPRINAIHGGVLATGLDVAGGLAAMTTLTSIHDEISTIDMRVDYLRSARGCDIIFEGIVTRKGNRIVTTNMKAVNKNDGSVLAEGKAVFNVKRKKSE